MMSAPAKAVCLAFLTLLLGACTAFELRDANQQLTSYYYALQTARANNDGEIIGSLAASLETLAKDAAATAEKEGDALNQIAFYRVAATAAWQAADPNVVRYATSGSAICNKGENFASIPRDCGMLLAIPVFAAADDTGQRFNDLQVEVTSAAARMGFQCAAEKLFAEYSDSTAAILAKRVTIAKSAADPSFIAAIDRNSEKLLCTVMENQAFGLVMMVGGDRDAALCEIAELKRKAFAAGLSANSMVCLPAEQSELGDVCTLALTRNEVCDE